MSITTPKNTKRGALLQHFLLFLLLLSAPFACLSGASLGDALFGSPFDFFEGEVIVENQTAETLYLTPISTTYAEPRLILQPLALRQRDHRIKPNASLVISYDTADFPLAGVVVCREKGDCRVLDRGQGKTRPITDFNALPPADESWVAVIENAGLYTLILYKLTKF